MTYQSVLTCPLVNHLLKQTKGTADRKGMQKTSACQPGYIGDIKIMAVLMFLHEDQDKKRTDQQMVDQLFFLVL